MYNSELKKRYIEIREREVTLPNNYLTLQFEKVAEYEEELGKDVSCFTAYEILEYYKIRNLHSIESLQSLNSQLSLYAQWCLQENLVQDNQNHFLELNKEILNGCVNKYVLDKGIVSRETLLQWIYELPNPKDQFILLSLFEYGKTKNFTNIVYVTMSDIDEDNNRLSLPDGRVVAISDELKNIAYNSHETYDYYSITGKGVKVVPLVSFDNRIVKNYPNASDTVSEFQKSRVIYNSVVRSLDYVGAATWCSANSLVVSGKIHMIRKRATELNITPTEYLYSEYLEEVNKQFGGTITRSIFGIKYQEHLR